MRIPTLFLLLTAFLFAEAAEGGKNNLLINSGIEEFTQDGKPNGWSAPEVEKGSPLHFAVETMDDSHVLTVRVSDEDTTELYGYWCQVVKLPGPGIYRLSFKIRTEDMNFAYWLSNATDKTRSVTVLKVFPASSGERSKDIIGKFVDAENLRTFSGKKWQTISVAVDFGKMDAGSEIAVRIGAMAASAGWIAIDDVVLCKEK